MRTYLECIPCFMKQTVQTGRLCNLEEKQIKHLLDIVGRHLEDIQLGDSPPVMAEKLQQLVSTELGNSDPYKAEKVACNEAALHYYPAVRTLIETSKTPLKTAIQAAIAGNIIDYGAVDGLDVQAELEKLMQEEEMVLDRENGETFAYDAFSADLGTAERILYIGDNAGEIVFDRALIETILELYPAAKLTFVTRGYPILNDVLPEDAKQTGLNTLVPIVSSGATTPGLVLETCTEEFLELFRQADLIISKGQGNYEALSSQPGPIYFLLMAKCNVVASELGCELRDIVLKKQTPVE
ncbi:MAG: damage-control phosphatase ARMT1 family protein [Spirochaetota bacterium]